MLKEKFNLTQIGEKIGKHRTTISKAILNHCFKKDYIQYNTYFANCVNVDTCENAGTKWCKHSCKNYKEKECVLLNTPPYVCNGCSKKSRCRLSKYYYRAKDANNNIFLLEILIFLEKLNTNQEKIMKNEELDLNL